MGACNSGFSLPGTSIEKPPDLWLRGGRAGLEERRLQDAIEAVRCHGVEAHGPGAGRTWLEQDHLRPGSLEHGDL